MNTRKLKNRILHYRGFLAFLFILFHLGITFIYVGPQEIVTDRLRRYSSYYMVPFFNQQWSLFAPAPVCEQQIYYSNPSLKEWKNLVLEDHKKADQFLLTSHWRFSIGSHNLMYWVNRDLEYFEKSNGGRPPVIKEKYFKRYFSNKLLKKFTRSFLERNKINVQNASEHHVKCRWVNFEQNDTTEVTFIYNDL